MPLCKVFSRHAYLQEIPNQPNRTWRRDSTMLHGEYFKVVEYTENLPGKKTWAYGVSILDGYEGWMPDTHLTCASKAPTHAVMPLMANAYIKPDFKSRVKKTFSFMSRLTLDATSEENGFLKMPRSSNKTPDLWVPKQVLLDLDTLSDNHDDLADIARLFYGCPYEYGGRTAWGIDCSGLVQLALQSRNIFCPRDADQQEMALLGNDTGYNPDYGQNKLTGTLIENFNACRRGDVIFFNDQTKDGSPTVHVGIVEEPGKILNANTRHHRVVSESLDAMMDHYRHGKPKETAIKSIWRIQL